MLGVHGLLAGSLGRSDRLRRRTVALPVAPRQGAKGTIVPPSKCSSGRVRGRRPRDWPCSALASPAPIGRRASSRAAADARPARATRRHAASDVRLRRRRALRRPSPANRPMRSRPTAMPIGADAGTSLRRCGTGSGDAGWLPVLDDRSPDPEICPFLPRRRRRPTGRRPIEAPDPANRCAALRDAVPQSLRQQELVCLASGHINCPRYLRGAVVVAEVPAPVVRTASSLSHARAGVLPRLGPGGQRLGRLRAGPRWPGTGRGRPASPGASVTAVAAASASPTPTCRPDRHGAAERSRDRRSHAVPDATSRVPARHRADPSPAAPTADTDGQADPDLRPIRAPGGVSGDGALLDLSSPGGRQPVQHRPLLRRLARQHLRPQPVGPDPGSARRPGAPAAAADALADPVSARP